MPTLSNVDREAMRRINDAAEKIRSAVRLGASAADVFSAVSSAVTEGAEQYAADVVDEWNDRAGRAA